MNVALVCTSSTSQLMGLSIRHTRRILAAYKEEVSAALAHGHLGRRAPNAISEDTKAAVLHLARTRYVGTNHTHMSELLREYEGIEVAVKECLVRGMLIQIDGSYHRWLGEDGPQFTLLLEVDDATGIVASALFCELEKTRSYFQLLEALIRHCGLPLALYTDRHAVFKHTPSSDSAAAPTQFSRAMDELGIQLIFAQSPTGQGTSGTRRRELSRIGWLRSSGLRGRSQWMMQIVCSRTFLRASTAGSRCLPRSLKPPTGTVDDGIHLEKVLCFKHRRRVARDNTVRYRWRTLQLLPGTDRTSYAGAVVDVLKRLDGHPGSAAPRTGHPLSRGTATSGCPSRPRRENRTHTAPSPAH